MKSKTIVPILFAAMAALGCVAFVVVRSKQPLENAQICEPVMLAQSTPSGIVLEEPYPDRKPVESIQPAAAVLDSKPARTKEDVLREFWGERWPEISAILKDKQTDFAQQPAEELEPWESVVAEACERMRMDDSMRKFLRDGYMAPVPMTNEYLRQKFGPADLELHPENLIELDAILEQSSNQGTAAFNNFESAINIELANKCARGDYYYGPYTTSADARKRSDPTIFTRAYVVKGWAVKCAVWQDEVPHVTADIQVLQHMQQIQRPLISKYLASIRKQ